MFQTRSLRGLVVVMLLLAALGFIVARQTNVVVPDVCLTLDPVENWFAWWWHGCSDGEPAAGGGGGGAK